MPYLETYSKQSSTLRIASKKYTILILLKEIKRAQPVNIQEIHSHTRMLYV